MIALTVCKDEILADVCRDGLERIDARHIRQERLAIPAINWAVVAAFSALQRASIPEESLNWLQFSHRLTNERQAG